MKIFDVLGMAISLIAFLGAVAVFVFLLAVYETVLTVVTK